VDGFSKTYAMTGWRLGYGIMPVGLAQRVELLLTHSIGCTAHFTQVAGIEAVRGSQAPVDEVMEAFSRRREIIVDGLNDLPGVSCQKPQGAFYVFPNITAPARRRKRRSYPGAIRRACYRPRFGRYGGLPALS
jgi:aspartate/methionine/tyrosine aminotransferase